jgi:methionyl-tRNA synthetase
VARANELADGLGNLVNRTITLVRRYRPHRGGTTVEPSCDQTTALHAVIKAIPDEIDNTLARFDFRAATASVWRLVDEGNRFVSSTQPWELAKAETAGDANAGAELDEVLSALLVACGLLARELEPFLPAASARIARALAEEDPQLGRCLFTKVNRRLS